MTPASKKTKPPSKRRRTDDLAEMNVDAKDAAAAAKSLINAFVFNGTREGGDYWWKVYERLINLAEASVSPKARKRRSTPTPSKPRKRR